MKKVVRRFFLRLFLLLMGLTVVAIWKPEWRQAAFNAATPYLHRATAPAMERVHSWTGRYVGGKEAPPSPVEKPASPAEITERADKAERNPGGEAPKAAPGTAAGDSSDESIGEAADEPVRPSGNLPPKVPALRAAPPLPAAVKALRDAAEARPSAVGYRRLADAAAAAGFTALSAEAYLSEAKIYRRLGDTNAAAVEELKAGRYRAEGRLFLHSASAPPASLYTGARLEPAYGALLGAFIDRDDQIDGTYQDENWQTHRDEGEFARLTGKKHASLFCYLQYGKPFPRRWAERLRDAGAIPHIAWEPRSLAAVRDDGYLREFAGAVAGLDAPIFIRFAGEMNGDWTPYHGDPAQYRQKFRLVYKAITSRAPKAALIWCVNNVPEVGIEAYYPGDDAVDWVGVNLYNVLYFDNQRDRPADRVHPADLLQGVYRRYAARKPIAICEYAASHLASIDPRPRPEYAVNRLSQMYAALPRLFPRVKMIDWFDCDNLKHARPERQLNNYSLTDTPAILSAYRSAVAPDYYLTSLDDRPKEAIRALAENEGVSGIVKLSAWVRCHLDRPRVYLLGDDQVLYAGNEPGAQVCRWDTRTLASGTHTLRLLVLDGEGRKVLEEKRPVRVTARDAPD